MQKPWFEDDSLWKAVAPVIFTDHAFEQARIDADALVRLTGVGTGQILDVCCGPGRFAIPLAEKRFQVTGVDRTPYFLGRAAALAKQHGVTVELVQDDIRSFSRPNTFQLVINMMTSFGYSEDEEENKIALAHIYENLAPGGTFLIDIMGKEILSGVFKETLSQELEDGSLVIRRHRIRHGWNLIDNQWLIVQDGVVQKTVEFTHWLYSARELKELMMEAGFTKVRVYGDLEGGAYDIDAERMILTGIKS
jgi:SAM-dependent methyltransferase